MPTPNSAEDFFKRARERGAECEGKPGVYSTIWCLCYKTNELKKKGKKETTGGVKWAK